MSDPTRDELLAENELLRRQVFELQRQREIHPVSEDLPVMVWQSDVNKMCIYTNRYAQEFTAGSAGPTRFIPTTDQWR